MVERVRTCVFFLLSLLLSVWLLDSRPPTRMSGCVPAASVSSPLTPSGGSILSLLKSAISRDWWTKRQNASKSLAFQDGRGVLSAIRHQIVVPQLCLIVLVLVALFDCTGQKL